MGSPKPPLAGPTSDHDVPSGLRQPPRIRLQATEQQALATLPSGVAGAIVVATAAGVWASDVVERFWGQTDPGRVVIDEVAGQLVTLIFHPANPATLAAGFFFFRLFDVLKPFPARRFEALHGGRGIMADQTSGEAP